MEAYETPQALKDDLLLTHVSYRVDQAYAVESELDEGALSSGSVKLVRDEISAVLDLLLTWLEDERVSRLNVVVDDIVGQDTTLTLRQEKEWKILIELTFTCRWLVRVVNIEDTAGKARTHLTAVVAVHTEGASLA